MPARVRIEVEILDKNRADKKLRQIEQSMKRLKAQQQAGIITEKQAKKATEGLTRAKTLLAGRINVTSRTMRRANRDTKAWAGGLKKVAAGALAVAAAFAAWQIRRIVTGAIQDFARFQLKFAEVTTLIDTRTPAARRQVARLREEILTLDPALGSATELTGGLYQAISAGVKPAAAIRLVGEAALFAKVAITDTFTSVDLFTTILNAYGIAAGRAAEVSSILFATIQAGKTTGPALAASLGRVIPVAAALKVELVEVGAAVATLTKGGFATAEAVTSIRATLKAFLRPTAEAEKILKLLGLTADQLRTVISEQGLSGALKLLKERTGDNLPLMARFFESQEALTGVLALTGSQAGEYTVILGKLREAQDDGNVTSREAEKIAVTLDDKLKTLRNSYELLGVRILESNGLMAAAVDVVTELLRFESQSLADSKQRIPLLDEQLRLTRELTIADEKRRLEIEKRLPVIRELLALESAERNVLRVSRGEKPTKAGLLLGAAPGFDFAESFDVRLETRAEGVKRVLKEVAKAEQKAREEAFLLNRETRNAAAGVNKLQEAFEKLRPIPSLSEADMLLLGLIDKTKKENAELAEMQKLFDSLKPIPAFSEADKLLIELTENNKKAKKAEEELGRQAEETARAHQRAFERMAGDIEGFFNQVFLTARSFGDVWRQLIQQMVRVFVTGISQMVARWISGMNQMNRASGGGGGGGLFGSIFNAVFNRGRGGAAASTAAAAGVSAPGLAPFSTATGTLVPFSGQGLTAGASVGTGGAGAGSASGLLGGLGPLGVAGTFGLGAAALGLQGLTGASGPLSGALFGGLLGVGGAVALGAALGAPIAVGLAAGIVPGLILAGIGALIGLFGRGKKKRQATKLQQAFEGDLKDIVEQFKKFELDFDSANAAIDTGFAAFQQQSKQFGKHGRRAVRSVLPNVAEARAEIERIQGRRDQFAAVAGNLIPEFAGGGFMSRTGLAFLHQGEAILDPGAVRLLGRRFIAAANDAGRNGGSQPAGGGSLGTTVNIQPGAIVIHAAPGQSEQRIANLAIRGLKRWMRDRGVSL